MMYLNTSPLVKPSESAYDAPSENPPIASRLLSIRDGKRTKGVTTNAGEARNAAGPTPMDCEQASDVE
jgi:hypothetical protein